MHQQNSSAQPRARDEQYISAVIKALYNSASLYLSEKLPLWSRQCLTFVALRFILPDYNHDKISTCQKHSKNLYVITSTSLKLLNYIFAHLWDKPHFPTTITCLIKVPFRGLCPEAEGLNFIPSTISPSPMISILSPLSNRQRNAPSPVIRSTHSPANTMSSTTKCLLYNSVPRINPKFLHFLNELPIAYIIHLYGPDSFQNSTFDIRVSPILVAKNLAKQREREREQNWSHSWSP